MFSASETAARNNSSRSGHMCPYVSRVVLAEAWRRRACAVLMSSRWRSGATRSSGEVVDTQFLWQPRYLASRGLGRRFDVHGATDLPNAPTTIVGLPHFTGEVVRGWACPGFSEGPRCQGVGCCVSIVGCEVVS